MKYLISSTSRAYLKTQGRTATALHVHELFMIISARTRITKKFRAVLDSDDNWNGVEAGIQIILGGTKVAAPARDDDDREVREWHPSRVLHPPWWATRRVVSLFLLTLSPIVFYCRQIFETGRYRFCCSMLSLFFFVVSGFYLFKGPAVLPGVVLSLADALDADEEEDDAPSEVSEASDPWAAPKPDPAVASTPPRPSAPPPDIESPAVAKISAEMTELREMMQAMMGSPRIPAGAPGGPAAPGPAAPAPTASPPLDALLGFANNQVPAGPISHTAAAQLAAQGLVAPVDGPSIPPGVPQPLGPAQGNPAVPNASAPPAGTAGWAPALSGQKSANQAGELVKLLNQWEGQRGLNAYWGVNF